ncbi:MAG: pilus assembly protein [Candidatus Dormibacteraeota bacterium]|nr:pilus assembly protein [Candidatus Dormibacteraeota bacterium]
MRRRHISQRGQAVIETAVVFVVLVLLLSGVSAVGGLSDDQNTATTAVRSGGRFAAELGNGSSLNLGGSTDPWPVDSQVVSEVCRIMNGMPNLVTINDVIIYGPQTNSNGSYSASDLHDIYTFTSVPNCTVSLSPTPVKQYTLDLRPTRHPNEAQVGILVQYQYRSPTPFFQLNVTAGVYTVVAVSPSFS